jgi:hypothetical protein
MRPAGLCVLGHTLSIVLSQQNPQVHHISIFSLQAIVHSTRDLSYLAEFADIASELSIDWRFA